LGWELGLGLGLLFSNSAGLPIFPLVATVFARAPAPIRTTPARDAELLVLFRAQEQNRGDAQEEGSDRLDSGEAKQCRTHAPDVKHTM
jgi:hypothetical protein